MTRKHFEAVASTIRNALYNVSPEQRDVVRFITTGLADTFQADNPRFDRMRFFDACGL